MNKVIITGASGFIGTALVKRLLADNCEVYAVVRDVKTVDLIENERLHVVCCDMREYDKLPALIDQKEFCAFYHLAWDGTFGESFRDYRKQLRNAACTVDALIAAKALSCKRFVMVGSMVQLEARQHLLQDGAAPRTSCIYGVAKEAAGLICRTLAAQNDMPFNLAILANVYGEGDQSNMIQNVLIRALLQGNCPKLADGNSLHDWIYVEDVVSALVTIAAKGIPNRTYYVGHREWRTFEEWVSETRDVVAPEVFLKFGEYPGGAGVDFSSIDLDGLYRDTGFVCTADFRKSIQKTAEWLKTVDW